MSGLICIRDLEVFYRVGVPDEEPSQRPRQELDKIVYGEKYGEGYF